MLVNFKVFIALTFLSIIILSLNTFAIDIPENTILIEAEAGEMEKGVEIIEEDGASMGKAIDSAKEALTIHEIDIPKAGKWYVWVRLYCPDGSADSYWIGMDDATANPNDAAGGAGAVKIYSETGDSVNTPEQPFNIWYWDSGVKSEPPANRFFDIKSPGKYKLWSKGREPRTLLDQILLTMDPDFNAEEMSEGEAIQVLQPVDLKAKLSIQWGRIKQE
jgi:hypothetical protein